ncbi:DUF1292 domain-containing protein [Paenibacillus alginolyticus]|uniref:DUF1292 domain-containing protein n=1 Tax=Paenibacillus alginolyticus TaxID=59839 RepID=UPI0004291AB5|nr:DUF1292 domain-containing protein [Paenibacillus alginolyticus]MCY9665842.1 DUF1292 domain-containing protein [Paenibacillus alginolyticus]
MTTVQDNTRRKATVDFIMANENNETIKCSFKKLFEYSGNMYVAFEDTTETIQILRVKDPYGTTPKLVEIPKDHLTAIHNFYKSLMGERPIYTEPS